MRQRKLVDIFSSVNKSNEEELHNANGKNHVLREQNVEDMEDFKSNGKSLNVGPKPIVRSYETNHKEKADHGQNANPLLASQQPIDIPTEHIDRHVDYQGWLDSRKRKWKQVREKRKRQR